MIAERNSLSGTELYNILCSIYNKEIKKYMISLTIKGLDDNIKSLPEPKQYTRPTFSYPYGINIKLSIIIMAVCAVIGFIYGTFFSQDIFGDGPIIFNILIPIPGLICGIIAALAGLVLSIPVNLVSALIIIPKAKKELQKDIERYEVYVVNAKNQNQKILAQKEILLNERKILCSDYEKESDELKKLYFQSGIDESFCTPVSVAIMLRLMKLEICDHLTGNDGLYAMLRNEYKQLYIISKLDDINDKLNQINNTLGHIAGEISFLINDMEEMHASSQALLTQIMNRL